VDAQLSPSPGSPTIFGLSAASTPVHFTFVVNTDLAPVTTLPAGTVVSNNNSTLPTKAQLIAKSSITNLGLAIGTAAWTESDVYQNHLPNGQPYAVMLLGELADGATPQIFMALDNPTGTLGLGTFGCGANAPCVAQNLGGAYTTSGEQGDLANIQASVTALSKTPSEQITDISNSIDLITTIDKGTKTSFAASLGGAQDKLDPLGTVDITAAKGKLAAFINKVQAQSGKKLTAQQANDLIAAANAIIAGF